MAKEDLSYHRPFLRSAVARSLFERMQREEQLRRYEKSKWYLINRSVLQAGDANIVDKFVEMSCDIETEAFLTACYDKSDWFFTHVFHSIARSVLSIFGWTSTSINGFLGRGSMFVLSSDQFKLLYDQLPSVRAKHDSRLLDLGAGDGKVTEVMAQYFRETHATEMSPVMKRLLCKKNYKVLDVERWYDESGSYDMISCLNLLDRCEKPASIISQMKTKLKPNGRILLALVLPFSQYVETTSTSGNASHKPVESLNITGSTFEEQLLSLNKNLLTVHGLEIVKWTRLPYLCEGDLDLSFYWLHDVVMVLKVADWATR